MDEMKKETPSPKAGQWWGVSRLIDGLKGAEGVRRLTGEDCADVHRARRLAHDEHVVYLGDGEQPKPTPWMIEQLARVAYHSVYHSVHLTPWKDCQDKANWREGARLSVLDRRDPVITPEEAVRREMHAVLRSLGYA